MGRQGSINWRDIPKTVCKRCVVVQIFPMRHAYGRWCCLDIGAMVYHYGGHLFCYLLKLVLS